MSTEAGSDALHCDVLVIGSGAGGFSAAIRAKKFGLDTLMIEKESCFGGTTALSGGWLWIPCNPLARRAGVADSLEQARAYLRHEIGERNDAARIDAFLEAGPRMVEFFELETALSFMLGTDYPDYHPDQPGGRAGGRAICAEPFDGRQLGTRLADLRLPAREMTLFGIKVGSGPDFRHFCNASRSLRSALYVLGRILRHAADVVLHGRDLLLMSGNALVARLAKTAIDLDIPIWLDSPADALIFEGSRVTGARVRRNGSVTSVIARCGVVLATGGFPHDLQRRQRLYRHAPARAEHYSLASSGNTGDGLALAESAGGQLDPNCDNAAAWMPVSRVPRSDASFGTYPHSFERGKPGVIMVNRAGARFTNESDSYHDVVRAMIDTRIPGEPVMAFLICDTRFIRRYGLGMAKPFPVPLGGYLRSGYLHRGESVEALAAKIGINAVALRDTIANFNTHAAAGTDPVFHRGENAYNRYLGDTGHEPNPCLAPIIEAPFYAVSVLPGDLGTFQGLRTDRHARVLDHDGQAIAGLYAVGSDMASIFAGSYPAPGINLGPAMTFGYLCAQHIAQANGLAGGSGSGD